MLFVFLNWLRRRTLEVTACCRSLFFIALIFCLLTLPVAPATAADVTTPGVYSMTGGNQQITISVSYSDDANGDNSLLIEWAEAGADWSERLGSVTLEHAASPYLYTISGLTNQTAYQLRITLKDGDMPDDVRIFPGIFPFNPLIHSSLSTGSSRWAAAGGWGVVSGKYGQFSCATCHEQQTVNAKRIKVVLAVTDPDSSDQFPITGSGTVSFTSTLSGIADLGDDSRNPATSSNNICEACHSQTNYHRYDTTGQPGGLSHYNKSDCIKCHHHHDGFTAGCNGCHDNPPSWNSHPAHLEEGRMLTALSCPSCHQGVAHLSGGSELGFDSADSRLSAATYNDADPTSRYTELGGYGETPAYASCQALYCHSNGNPFDGSIAYQNPTWGGAAMTCSSCHEHAGDTTSLSSNHPKHVGSLYSFACPRCHATTVSDSTTISDNSLHLNLQKDVSLSAGGDFTAGSRACANLYCHSDGQGNPPNRAVAWSDTTATVCVDCHGDLADPDPKLASDSYKMTSGAHDVLTSSKWIREYPCQRCHYGSVELNGAIKSGGYHVNGEKDVAIDPYWVIAGRPAPSYDSANKNCDNLYCHSDGQVVDPVTVDLHWDTDASHCDSCHGHQGDCVSCHDGSTGKPVITAWPLGDEWKNATPMYENTGPGTDHANSHVRHLQTNFSCENCHFITIKTDDGTCGDCHIDGQAPTGAMDENGHIQAANHVNKVKDVVFKDGGTYNADKTCSATACHSSDHADPQWGGRVKCLTCHRTTGADIDDFDAFNGTQARINLTEWETSGHGRPTVAGPYPSGNPPANFPTSNPCDYCHDRTVEHERADNPYRLVKHPQFAKRFEKECLYCHMEGIDGECLGCHAAPGSLAKQISTILAPTNHVGMTSCVTATCHSNDSERHKTGAGVWTAELKADVKNQYMMMGVCLQCHDNDDNNRCNSCHSWGGTAETNPYVLGYNPGSGFIAGSSKASSAHFGHKHWQDYLDTGRWKGGKFCWDCHDPHGDSNIYMIQSQVATQTEGSFGKPVSRSEVIFTGTTGGNYATSSGATPYKGICNVCHTSTQHFRADYGDNHRGSRRCTSCHEHGFGGGHASDGDCGSCHQNKPIPNHLGFGLPRDCVKCHDGVIKLRTDILRQFKGQSHHVQGEGVVVENQHCYQCHWEATEFGLIDNDHHAGYNYKTYQGVANAPSDLVIYAAEARPSVYQLGVTAVTFDASKIGTADERTEVAKISTHCLGCHSDQNNDYSPFNDCRTPRQYAWDRQSIAARYAQTDTTIWGKYSGINVADKNLQKAFSAHGNAVANQGGWDAGSGEDGALPDTRAGTQNVQCFDCHNSHGSFTSGVTSSYQTFDGSYGGGNLKETQAGKGGYAVTYKAVGKTDGINPMSPAAAQCFDCHETATAGSKPWGYNSTFGATAPIMGYRDSSRFGDGERGTQLRFPFKAGRSNMGGHLQSSSALSNAPDAEHQINGSCTPCHDPHGVTPTLGADQAYAVPLLKGTWLTSPFKEDSPQVVVTNPNYGKSSSTVYPGRKTFGTVDGSTQGVAKKMNESASQFAGLCLRCHPKENLTDGINKNTAFKSLDRVHETVTGWGNNAEHSFSCSKCHQPHVSGLPRLMRTNCLDWNHRGNQPSGGLVPRYRSPNEQYPQMRGVWPDCHETQTGTWNNQKWNEVTPW